MINKHIIKMKEQLLTGDYILVGYFSCAKNQVYKILNDFCDKDEPIYYKTYHKSRIEEISKLIGK